MTKEEFNLYYKELEKKVEKIVNKYDCNAAIHFIIGYLSADMKNVFTGTQIYELFTIPRRLEEKDPVSSNSDGSDA